MRTTLALVAAPLLLLGSAVKAQNDVVHLNLSMVELSPTSSSSSGNSATGVLEVSIHVAVGTEVEATDNTLAWNPDDLGVFGCKLNEAIDKSLFEIYRPSGCIEGRDCSELRTLVMTTGPIEPFEDGIVLYTCEVGLPVGSASALLPEQRTWTIRCLNPFSVSPNGEPLLTACNDTTVILRPTPTHSPTPIPTLAPTATAPIPTDTVVPTATRPAPTETVVAATPTLVPISTPTTGSGIDDDGCQVGAPGGSSLAWVVTLAMPVFIRRRKSERS